MEWFLTILVYLAGAFPAAFPAPEFRVELQKAVDTVVTAPTRDSAVISITSKTGEGGASLVRTGKTWPSRITIRLNLTRLDAFDMDNGVLRFSKTSKNQKQWPYWRIMPDGEPLGAPSGTLDLAVVQDETSVRLSVPKEILTSNPKQIRFRWIGTIH